MSVGVLGGGTGVSQSRGRKGGKKVTQKEKRTLSARQRRTEFRKKRKDLVGREKIVPKKITRLVKRKVERAGTQVRM